MIHRLQKHCRIYANLKCVNHVTFLQNRVRLTERKYLIFIQQLTKLFVIMTESTGHIYLTALKK